MVKKPLEEIELLWLLEDRVGLYLEALDRGRNRCGEPLHVALTELRTRFAALVERRKESDRMVDALCAWRGKACDTSADGTAKRA